MKKKTRSGGRGAKLKLKVQSEKVRVLDTNELDEGQMKKIGGATCDMGATCHPTFQQKFL